MSRQHSCRMREIRKVFPFVGTRNVDSDQKECGRTYIGDLELFLY